MPNLTGRDFTAPAPGRRLVGDITCLPTPEGWLYPVTVIDLHNREVIGHAMADHMRAELARDALSFAVERGLISGNAVFHADRDTPPGCSAPALAGHCIRTSVGRTGSCFDNAVAESFFATLKTEIGTTVRDTRDDARRGVFAYLGYYNHDRLHSTLDYRTPQEVRVGCRRGLALVA
ncbi:transposase InsO family protein [Saccharothrix coeruleofusca]|uniref:integrase core domain-containing protein n=1 Tax=Saccharothrix coeruleofusca TaxID=33919 RepID=UPI0027DC92A8|nr:integrase core domain-containing protein [Saccharothrix coeruleofusca]MBP2334754.1 transposase InsO family protein [Saccharothrix coeruleofusca]